MFIPLAFQIFHVFIRCLQSLLDADIDILQFRNGIQRTRIRPIDTFQFGRFHKEIVLVFRLSRQKLFRFFLIQDRHRVVNLNIPIVHIRTNLRMINQTSKRMSRIVVASSSVIHN